MVSELELWTHLHHGACVLEGGEEGVCGGGGRVMYSMGAGAVYVGVCAKKLGENWNFVWNFLEFHLGMSQISSTFCGAGWYRIGQNFMIF